MSRRHGREESARLPVRSDDTSTNQEVTVQHEQHLFSGPLPAPDVPRGYDELLPGAAERIIRMAEKEQTHTHEAGLLALRETGVGRFSVGSSPWRPWAPRLFSAITDTRSRPASSGERRLSVW